MTSEELYHFVEQYVRAQGCTIIDKGPSHLTVHLSVQADKDIMGRPYYWMFMERTGAEPEPMTITFCFDPEQMPENTGTRTELIQFGCWRLHQIFQSCQKHGQFIRLYEEGTQASLTRALTPWICFNYKISFISDQKKDLFYPLGFNLINGEILAPFDQVLNRYRLTPKIPDYHFTLTPIFSLKSALKRIEMYLYDYLDNMDKTWAQEANKRLDEEAKLICAFFQHSHHEEEVLQRRLKEIEDYRPKIEVVPINLGLFYLNTHPRAKLAAI
ncbi:hypothetical protein GCM10010965_10610 [Caldalkalibacillus thermarum]|uniref:YqhG family protein n=1 Tax=Caldalkalibacillus thermarum TaxID=296745 RepID=UPI00166716CA|nr:YqhG family protein [Caldalkalibacillus thermarum]GGK19412.1 hypothetical protein GCM10010965_10610 [Caldalkalibacillus thermarum]